MLCAVVPDQSGPDRLQGGMAADVPVRREDIRIALPCHQRADDPHAGHAGDVGDDMVKLEVHLHQSLLHVLDMRGRVFDETLALPQVGAQCGDLRLGPEAPAQQAVGMQLAQPSGIADIGLPARHVLGIARVHQDDLEAVLLEDLEGGYPVDAGRLHGHAGDTAGPEPGRQVVQILREGAEGAHGHGAALRADRRHVHRRPDVDRGGTGIDQLHLRVATGLGFRHDMSSA